MAQVSRYEIIGGGGEEGDAVAPPDLTPYLKKDELLQWGVLKAIVAAFEGRGTNDPLVIASYNVTSLTRTGIGEYTLTITQSTLWGYDISTYGLVPAPGVVIQDTTRAVYCGIVLGTPGSNTAIINVAEWVVGSGNKMELVPYDLEAGETVDVISFLLPRNDVLPPA